MTVPHLHTAAAESLELLTRALPGAAVTPYTLSSGRIWSLVGVLLGLAGVVIGALACSPRRSPGSAARTRAVVALVAGLAATLIGTAVVAAAEGGPGTGYGIVGGVMALVVGLAAVALGGLALARAHRAGRAATG